MKCMQTVRCIIYFGICRICIRRERGKCRVQLTPSGQERSFKLEGISTQDRVNAGTNNCRNDFIQFPGAANQATTEVRLYFAYFKFKVLYICQGRQTNVKPCCLVTYLKAEFKINEKYAELLMQIQQRQDVSIPITIQ